MQKFHLCCSHMAKTDFLMTWLKLMAANPENISIKLSVI